MKRRQLVLVRHAKATDGTRDLDRPLAPRGRRDAAAVGRYLAAARVTPQRVVLSPARRVAQTWEGVRSALATRVPAVVDDRVYDNDVVALLAVVRATPDDVDTLAVIGHNPSVALLAHLLDDGGGDADARRRLDSGYPTSGVAVLQFTGPWSALQPHAAVLTRFDAPRAEPGA